MAIYCGVDFQARQQTVCYCDMADREIHLKELGHQEDVRGFYAVLHKYSGGMNICAKLS